MKHLAAAIAFSVGAICGVFSGTDIGLAIGGMLGFFAAFAIMEG